jgi:hypothetical protein
MLPHLASNFHAPERGCAALGLREWTSWHREQEVGRVRWTPWCGPRGRHADLQPARKATVLAFEAPGRDEADGQSATRSLVTAHHSVTTDLSRLQAWAKVKVNYEKYAAAILVAGHKSSGHVLSRCRYGTLGATGTGARSSFGIRCAGSDVCPSRRSGKRRASWRW